MNVREVIRQFLEKECCGGPLRKLRDDDLLLDLGILDSVRVFQLMDHLETVLEFKFRRGDVSERTFRSIDSLTEYVEKYRK